MNQFVQEIAPVVMNAVATIAIAFIGYAAKSVKKYFDEKGLLKELEHYDYLADLAVKSVEQIYQNENGPVKFQRAKEMFIEHLGKRGFKVSENQLDMFLENAVKRMNEEWLS